MSGQFEFRPSVTVNYSIAWLNGYTEKGTTNANLKVDHRKSKALTARAQLAGAYLINDISEAELRIGVNTRHTNDNDTKVSIAGSQFKFATAGDEDVLTSYAGIKLRYAVSQRINMVTDIEAGGDSDEDYISDQISLQYTF